MPRACVSRPIAVERLQHADLVVRGHHADEDRVRPQRRDEPADVDEAVGLDRKARHLAALRFEPRARIQHRAMLGLQGDDVPALRAQGLRHPLDREIVRLGRAAGEDDVFRLGADQRGDLAAGVIRRLARGPAERMLAARGVAEAFGEVRQHRLHDPRIAGRGGVRIEVQRELHGTLTRQAGGRRGAQAGFGAAAAVAAGRRVTVTGSTISGMVSVAIS